MSPTWPHGDPQAVVRSILQDPRFAGVTTSAAPGPDPFTQLWNWLGDRIQALMHAIGHLLGASAKANNPVGIIVLLAIAAGLVVLLIRFLRLPGRRYPAGPAPAIALDPEWSSATLLAHARAAADDERWHDAASALARAAMRALDERERLSFDPTRTPGEARRLLRDPAFDAFEREATTALFAERGATADRFTRMGETYAAVFGNRV